MKRISWRKTEEDERLFQLINEKNLPRNIQVGGDHYRNMTYQPIHFISDLRLDMFQGCIVKALARWNAKGEVQDLKKALHYALLANEDALNQERENFWKRFNFSTQFQEAYVSIIIDRLAKKDWLGVIRFLLRLLEKLEGGDE